MITGRQIREARKLLRWDPDTIAERAKVDPGIVQRAEHVDDTPSITLAQAARIQHAYEAAGIRFGSNGAVMKPGP